MGKIKRRVNRHSRYSPANITGNGKSKNSNVSDSVTVNEMDHHSNGAEIHSNSGTGGLKNAQEKILSVTADEKITGLNMIAAYALEPNAAESIVSSGIVSSIAPLLRDNSSQVRLAAAGALRNLAAWGSDEAMDLMVQQDILDPLSQLLKSYENNTPQPTESQTLNTYGRGVAHSMEESDPQDLVFVHATNVLWSLCECNEEAMNTFNQEGLVSILLKHINPYVWGYAISLSTADCLFCVTENNDKAKSAILPLGDTLRSLVAKSLNNNSDPFAMQFAAVITGVLINIGYWDPCETNSRQVFEVLSEVLSMNASLQLRKVGGGSTTKAEQMEKFEHVVSGQMVALEILSNVCTSSDDDDETEWEDADAECEDEDEGAATMECDVNTQADALEVLIIESITHYKLMDETYNKTIKPELDDVCGWGADQETNKIIEEKLLQLQIRALQCFQNLVCCLQVEDLGGAENLREIWRNLAKQAFTCSPEPDLLEASCCAMRAIIQRLNEVKDDKHFDLSPEEYKRIFDCVQCCSVASVRANLCRMVGTLADSFLRHRRTKGYSQQAEEGGQGQQFLVSVVDFLLKVGQNDEALNVCAEAIDVIIDVFSDDDTDDLAMTTSLVDRLKVIQPQFKAKFNRQKKKLGDHRPLVMTVRDNLNLFIKYKATRTQKTGKMNH